MAAGVEQVSNLAYERWYDQDQQLLSGLLSSMIEEVLRDVVNAKSSREVWDSLQKKFTSSSKVCMVQIHVEHTTVKKRYLYVADFFCKIKGLALSSPLPTLLSVMRRFSPIFSQDSRPTTTPLSPP
jgi:hypothetical protein